MGLEVKDRDWMVVGSSPDEMAARGFRPVGRDFPVFLHPRTGEEYALARTERKTAPGYHGFVFNSSPDVSVEQDLGRRDLTMNAMAMDPDGNLIDPFGGAGDIRCGIIRHVSDAFREDPVRILRTARFAARYRGAGFSVAEQTLGMMSDMVDDGEADALVPERVWQELFQALCGPDVAQFILTLRQCGALKKILPEVDALFGIPQTAKFHPEIDTGIHILMALDAAEKISADPVVRFAVLVHDLGKAMTPDDVLPSHRGHEMAGLDPIKGLCERLRVPGEFGKFALMVCRHHLNAHRIAKMNPGTVLRMLEQMDAFRSPGNIERFKQCCIADSQGRAGHETDEAAHLDLMTDYHLAAGSVDEAGIASEVRAKGGSGRNAGVEIKNRIREARLEQITQLRNRRAHA
ncbi:MAG: multifunctional CCA addition/repair protein [Gammaproteobacteria bacterium]|nr:multifunctional CCA addition/repair protein [Gammaproteobacteria bacterium]MYD76962.1 multifunctional CCA addition/repair protein [Gammaproteobacteria bacterium]MYJ52677.1 multifunctional CCA addition/repair protein [Gammaproteobacteria bacterium]